MFGRLPNIIVGLNSRYCVSDTVLSYVILTHYANKFSFGEVFNFSSNMF